MFFFDIRTVLNDLLDIFIQTLTDFSSCIAIGLLIIYGVTKMKKALQYVYLLFVVYILVLGAAEVIS